MTLPTLIKGSWGAVDHDDMNRVFRAVEEVLAQAERDIRKPPKVINTFWAKLIAQETVADQPCWTFQQVAKLATPTVDFESHLLASTVYPSGQGRAIELSSPTSAAPNDRVLMHELVAFDGRRWFAFTKGVGSAGATVDLIQPTGNVSIGVNRWRYDVLPSSGGGLAKAENLYEEGQFGHGQPVAFAGIGNLTPGPVLGPGHVLGLKKGTITIGPTTYDLWKFEATNPMVPVCNAGVQ